MNVIGTLCIGSFFGVFSLIGVGLIWAGIRARQKADASQGWPATQGKVIHAEVRRLETPDDARDIGALGTGWNMRVSYLPKVEYEYEVLGQTYTASQMAFGARKAYFSQREAEKALQRYPEGATVTVYYNPDNPAEAVLERKADHTLLLIIAGVSFLLIASCVLLPMMLIVLRH